MPSRDPQRTESMLWWVVNWHSDVSVFEKLRFHPSTQQQENGVSRKELLWRASFADGLTVYKEHKMKKKNIKWKEYKRFRKASFSVTENAVSVCMQTQKKDKKYALLRRSGYVWTGP